MHAELQQTPSALHAPLLQSELALQPWPLGSLVPQRFVVLRQVSPAMQSASAVQVVRHEGLVALHLYGSQFDAVAAGQLPPPSQLTAGVKTLPAQLALRQPVAVDQGLHAPLPLQLPSFEQSPPAGLLATHRCLGSD